MNKKVTLLILLFLLFLTMACRAEIKTETVQKHDYSDYDSQQKICACWPGFPSGWWHPECHIEGGGWDMIADGGVCYY